MFQRPALGFRAVLLLLLLASGVAIVFEANAAPKRRRRGPSYNPAAAARARQRQAIVRAATAQLAAARQVLAAAEATGGAAQAKLDSTMAKLRAAADAFRDAQSTTRHLAKELAEIEGEILDEQPDDSPYAKASKRVQDARKKLNETEERILSEPAAQTQLSGLSGGKLLEKRASILELRPDYLGAKSTLDTEAGELARIRSDLFQSDKDWTQASEALAEARSEEKAAENKTRAGSLGRLSALSTIRTASQAAEAARAAIAQSEAAIRAAGGKKTAKSTKSRSASQNPLPKKKKK